MEQNREIPTSIGHFCRLAADEFLRKRPRRRPGESQNTCLLRAEYDSEIQRIMEEIGFEVVSLRAVDPLANAIPASATQAPIVRALGGDDQFYDAYPAVADYVGFLRRGHGILAVDGSARLSFRESLFRDYFAGCAMAHRSSQTIVESCRSVVWHAPLKYWASAQSTFEGYRLVTAVTAELVSAAEDDAACALTYQILAGELMAALRVAMPDVPATGLSRGLHRTVSAALTAASTDRAIPLDKRAKSATLYAQLNPVTWEESSRALVAESMCMSGGTFPVGSVSPLDSEDEKYRLIDWHPQRNEEIPSFRIAKFPVTNREYAEFILSGGYRDLDCWPEGPARLWAMQDPAFIDGPEGPRIGSTASQRLHLRKEMREGIVDENALQDYVDQLLLREVPLYWWDPRYNQPTQPVVGVNWWEALAYCRWLTKRLRENGSLDDRGFVDIPSEFEWERACLRGPVSQPYPWGEAWEDDMAHVRTEVNWIQQSVPVGIFPWATWEGGPQDMVGNVWEWTKSLAWSYSDARPGREDISDQGDRTVRGGSWFSREMNARKIQFRSYDPPQNAYVDLGFRVAYYTM
ncbi:SUMF1/EgtB/PvdO family nonheme iron enzyme [Streptomyces shenzhenensis]|uniref:SUMF1/EgtB/PvdO family nonheme iron enzyme n=1 Tax=Streptomyces shenzhenensis TaxID=943815 RepID=UPI001F28A602|nr:SUMF1/EgtB/PvdO family nonheme iron enzyme [Streptomyces shenzhenensis]